MVDFLLDYFGVSVPFDRRWGDRYTSSMRRRHVERLVEQRRDGKHNFYNLTDEGQELADLVAPVFGLNHGLEDTP